MASTRSEDTPPAATDGKGQLEEKAPVHDASTADHTVPAALQAKTKADLAKVAQTLREDATEGQTASSSSRPTQRALQECQATIWQRDD